MQTPTMQPNGNIMPGDCLYLYAEAGRAFLPTHQNDQTMQEQLAQRLSTLRQEYEKGRQKLETLDAERKALYETLLRISGAIQVLEEALNGADTPSSEAGLPE